MRMPHEKVGFPGTLSVIVGNNHHNRKAQFGLDTGVCGISCGSVFHTGGAYGVIYGARKTFSGQIGRKTRSLEGFLTLRRGKLSL
jgi:hypothetical protein